jgi:hypothetical protein
MNCQGGGPLHQRVTVTQRVGGGGFKPLGCSNGANKLREHTASLVYLVGGEGQLAFPERVKS